MVVPKSAVATSKAQKPIQGIVVENFRLRMLYRKRTRATPGADPKRNETNRRTTRLFRIPQTTIEGPTNLPNLQIKACVVIRCLAGNQPFVGIPTLEWARCTTAIIPDNNNNNNNNTDNTDNMPISIRIRNSFHTNTSILTALQLRWTFDIITTTPNSSSSSNSNNNNHSKRNLPRIRNTTTRRSIIPDTTSERINIHNNNNIRKYHTSSSSNTKSSSGNNNVLVVTTPTNSRSGSSS
mmetsp:Transcript_9064/g.22474  ORF Transcript_9064/g.22474 Transcript_9064/m.22474 type:complete len:238 (+) Transcript_9064:105-818(+)